MKYTSKLTPADAIRWLTNAVTENCETTCDKCNSFQFCYYGRSLKMATDALNVRYLCKYANPDDQCKHTSNIKDAKNFTEVDSGKFMEREITGFNDNNPDVIKGQDEKGYFIMTRECIHTDGTPDEYVITYYKPQEEGGETSDKTFNKR